MVSSLSKILKASYKTPFIFYSLIFLACYYIYTVSNILYSSIIKNQFINGFLTSIINNIDYIKYSDFKKVYPMKTESTQIYIFFHICTDNMDIVYEEIEALISSGLYSVATKIYYGCNCHLCDAILEKYFIKYSKFVRLEGAVMPDVKSYENATINAMLQIAKESPVKFNALYFHTKGTSAVSKEQQKWRHHMVNWMISKYKMCNDILNRGFNTVGMLYLGKPKRHYSGNFWWANSDYLKGLEPIINVEDRMEAEMILFRKYQEGKHITLTKHSYMDGLYYLDPVIENTDNPDIGII